MKNPSNTFAIIAQSDSYLDSFDDYHHSKFEYLTQLQFEDAVVYYVDLVDSDFANDGEIIILYNGIPYNEVDEMSADGLEFYEVFDNATVDLRHRRYLKKEQEEEERKEKQRKLRDEEQARIQKQREDFELSEYNRLKAKFEGNKNAA